MRDANPDLVTGVRAEIDQQIDRIAVDDIEQYRLVQLVGLAGGPSQWKT